MARIDFILDVSGLEKTITDVERNQLPFARSLAANQAAYDTWQVMRNALPLYIDKPTRFTVQSVRYRKGNKQAPVAEVYISGDGAKGTPPAKYLTVTRGGVRGQRRSERLLRRLGVLGDDEGWVPGKDVPKNAFGNPFTGGQVTRILSAVKAFREEGFSANRKRRRSYAGKEQRGYFLSRGDATAGKGPGATRFQRGIWERYAFGRAVRPVMLFVDLPRYQKSFDFIEITKREAQRRYVRAWPAAWRRARATARRR